MVISRVTHGSYMRNQGIWSITGSSHPILPWTTRMASAAAVIALPVEPVWKRVCASPGAVSPRLRGPQPRDRKSVVKGMSVSVRGDLGGRRSIKKKKEYIYHIIIIQLN